MSYDKKIAIDMYTVLQRNNRGYVARLFILSLLYLLHCDFDYNA